MNSITPNPSESQDTNALVKRYDQFGRGEIHNCPICDTPVKEIHLYEKWEPEMFSLYVLPCNHRLGLWSAAPEWTKAENIPAILIDEQYQETHENIIDAKKRLAKWNAAVLGKGRQS